ncbi:NUDIX hydrolase [Lutispora thermophila]|mgnify:CR=1 FL=1|uniref:NUDIX domain-containing protein n=1 Tax=Lutispora thermophila DSM 19022 TaxID=1122184 RepID=A0A1M6EW27_9FIRM|nr:CoA pyrophosphatase [Lutispora thermophila]SHI89618.1 NUDIX domain-containing protein [Lutispora thermophila DSM 19022]
MLNKIIKLSKKTVGISDSENHMESSVLIPIIESKNGLSLLYEVRSEYLKKQPNEICFPGGKIEKDENRKEAAIRETIEELLVMSENIEIISASDILVTPFNTIIYPYIGFLRNYQGTFNKDEVKEVFHVPLSYLLSTEPQCYYIDVKLIPGDNFPYDLIQNGKDYKFGRGKYPVYFYLFENKVIWGLTARITYDFVKNIKNL